ncbi:MAG: phenylalanine--tRNA ligase subunit beta [Clostridia bacterium]|nr:phenylalanine--tRNA ligase subunit beta [Clostridia bacterium]MBQ5613173.1 phenylalanine--tRNA ligase subunit beta [Clostridia bacterium]MBQ5772459.1 phenylalanine--tRNA ligase subunit beta [Clostridia bacterium]
MNLSRNWLSDFVNTDGIDNQTYCDKLTITGSKVEGFEVLGEEIENVVVAKVTAMEKHPDSDHLWICKVDAGDAHGHDIQIVTGAQNVFVGALVPAALPVAKLPGGVTIKAGKLRGVESSGMLCSMGELQLTAHDMPGKEENGILILDPENEDRIGEDIRDVLLLKDTSVEFEITSNRPDCLSVIGLARETAVSFDRPLTVKAPVVKGAGDGDDVNKYLNVKISAPDLCYRYAARVVKNVKIAPSPLWLRMRLRASGVRPINNIVDITNYVMLEYGQPMHAFDYTCLDGAAIDVRRAADGEAFRSLDDTDHTLDSSMLVIADSKKACALAGVMGGANSEITENTATVVFESACFNGASVRVTAKKNGMRTESSARFEKGLDPENCIPGLERACELVELLGAGDVVDGMIDVYPTPWKQTVLPFMPERYNEFLGMNIPVEHMLNTLTHLGCRVEDGKIYVPSFRADLGCMNDIAEEVCRIYGYDKIESSSMNAETTLGGRSPKQLFEVSTEAAMVGMGYSQIQTYSFISPKYYDKIRMPADSALRRSVVISNPLGEDTSVMRTTALPSMMEVLARNNNFNNEKVRLFEIATIYLPKESANELPEERRVLTLGAYGATDFYAMKGICENMLALAGIGKAVFTACTENDSYHPGRCAKILLEDGTELGIFGQAHPLMAKNYDFSAPVFVAELDFDALFASGNTEKTYRPLPKYPATTRDFSFVCDEDMEVGAIEGVMEKAGGKLVESVALFDIYRGPQVGEGKKSVSLRVTLRASDRTLTVEEADKVSKKILNDLKFKMGLELRG